MIEAECELPDLPDASDPRRPPKSSEFAVSVRVLRRRGNSRADDMKDSSLDSTDLTWLAGLARALLGEAHAADAWALQDRASVLDREAELLELSYRETLHAALNHDAELPEGFSKKVWNRIASEENQIAPR